MPFQKSDLTGEFSSHAGFNPTGKHATLWVEILQQFLFVVPAEIGAHAHVADDGPGDAGGKAFGRVVAARTVLLEDAFAVVSGLRAGVVWRLLRSGLRR